MTTSRLRGIVRSMRLRLCSAAPRITISVAAISSPVPSGNGRILGHHLRRCPMATRARPILLAISVAAGLVLALLVVARLALPGWLKGKVERLAGEATGRALTIGGPVEISLFGSPTLAVNDVRFANAPSGSEPSMVSAGRLAVTLELRPLLSGQVHLRRVELDDVRVLLERDAGGRPNWRLDLPKREPSGSQER